MSCDGTETTRWSKVETAFHSELHDPDMNAVRTVYSAVAAHFLPGAPVWLFDVAPPSSGKTEKLKPPEKAVSAHIISNVTPQTFLSGWTCRTKEGGKSDASLLTRIGPRPIVICKDFSQVLSMPRKQKGPILADLRDIYDGYIVKEYGTGEGKWWRGRMTFIAGTTPDLDMNYMVFQTLGERFVQVRSSRPGGVQAALRAMWQAPSTEESPFGSVVTELFSPIVGRAHQNPTIAQEGEFCIANLAEFADRARTHVPRDGRSREIIYLPEPEASPRLAQQLAQLARGSALLDLRPEVNKVDLSLVRRVAFDSIRADRRAILDILSVQNKLSAVSVTHLSKRCGVSQPAISRRVEELRGLGLVDCKDRSADFDAQEVRLSKKAWDLLAGVSDE